MRYRVAAVLARGPERLLVVEAESRQEAEATLAAQGFTVISNARAAGPAWRSRVPTGVAGSNASALVLLEQLRDLLNAGLSVIEALETLRHTARRGESAQIDPIITRLMSGHRLSEALRTAPGFSELLVNLIRASEETSDLSGAISRYLEHEAKVTELRHRIASIAVYPALLMLVGGGVLLFLLFYVVPRFARVFEGMPDPLPWSATAMVWWARTLSVQGPWISGALLLLAALAGAAVTSPGFRLLIAKRALDWAPLRERLRTYYLARWYRTTGMLCTGGVPLPEALSIANGVLPAAMRADGAHTLDEIRNGASPTDAYARSAMATPVAAQLMRAGERSGNLGEVLTRTSQFHDVALARSLERQMRAIEPIVMVLIGLAVGVIVVLMYLPVFELAASIR